MSVALDCPSCGSKLQFDETLLDKPVQCPNCLTKFPVVLLNPGRDDAPAGVTAQPAEPPLPPAPRPRRPERDDGYDENPFRKRRENDAVSSIIPYRNGKALAAYYCGVFSLIPCLGLLLGPIALILGILGFRYVRAHPEAKGTGHAIAGIILGSLTTLGNGVPVLVGIVMAIGSAVQSPQSPSPTRSTPPPPPRVAAAPNGQQPVAPDDLFLGTKTFLSDLAEFNVWPPGHTLGKNGDVGNATHDRIIVNGQASPKGLGLFVGQGGFGAVEYRLDGRYRGFQTKVAVNDSFDDNKTHTLLLVIGDGKLLWKSKALRTKGETDECRVDVTGVQVFQLRAEGGGFPRDVHTLWAEPCLYSGK
jgi:hypothetical protein